MSTCSNPPSARHEVNIFSRSLPRTIRQTSHAASQALAQKPIFLYSRERGLYKHQMEVIFHLPRKSPIYPAPQAVRTTASRGEASILSRIETIPGDSPTTHIQLVVGKQAS